MVAAVPGSHSAEVCLLDAFEGAMIRLRPGPGSHLLSPTSHLAGLPRLEAQGGISGHQIGGSYLRYTGRDDHGGATAAHDPCMVRPCVARGFIDLAALRSCINVSGL